MREDLYGRQGMIMQGTLWGIITRSPSWTDVEKFLGTKWSVLGVDKRSLALPEIDLLDVVLIPCLGKGEHSISGENRRARLWSSGHILLGANTFLSLKREEGKIPESWQKYKRIYFDGSTVLESPGNVRFVLFLEFDGVTWNKGIQSLTDHSYANHVSATLPWNYRYRGS